jgi:hypothetical protein
MGVEKIFGMQSKEYIKETIELLEDLAKHLHDIAYVCENGGDDEDVLVEDVRFARELNEHGSRSSILADKLEQLIR